jgi:hypothetical protein
MHFKVFSEREDKRAKRESEKNEKEEQRELAKWQLSAVGTFSISRLHKNLCGRNTHTNNMSHRKFERE